MHFALAASELMSQTVPTCPYVGLQPYTEAERDYFFGREQDTEMIAANLLTAPLTVLYGASGVGKTSVLAAGVAPYLRAMPNVLVVQYRAWQDETFLAALQAEIIHSARAAGWTISETRDLPLDEFLARAARETHCTFLLILDQFEEYFLYHPNATPFDEQFARAVNRDDVNANFLIALREDALAQLDRFETRIPNLMSNGLRLEYLDRAGAERAIRKPLEVYNARRPDEPPFAIEDALVDALIEQVRTGRVTLGLAGQGEVSAPATARVRIETPFLQMVLTRLWDEETRIGSYALRLETLNRLGGAEKIVRTHLDAVMSKLTAPEQEICATFFDRLVTPSGAKIAQSADDLVTYTARPVARVTPVLKKLDEARVLRPIAPPPQQPHVTRYEIFHDVLAPAILDWRRRFVERKRVRRQRWISLGATLIVLVFAVLTMLAFGATMRATTAERIAASHELAASALSNLNSDPELAALLALEAVQTAHNYESEDALRQAILTLPLATLRGHTDRVRSAAFSPGGTQIVTASWDDTARVWDTTSGRELATLRGYSAAFSPDGMRIVTASWDNTARVWDAVSGRELATLRGHTIRVLSAAFSPDGMRIVTASADDTARIWDATSGRELATLRGHTSSVGSAAFSPNGTRIATASYDKTARIWDAASGRELAILRGHTDRVGSAAFSPDGMRIVTASWDNTARIWDATSGRELATLRGHTGAVRSAAFSPDGTRIVTASSDGTARIYLVRIEDLITLARSRLSRELTCQEREKYLHEPPCR